MSKNISVFAYIQRDESILLVKHAYGSKKWHLPGGSVNNNESMKDAIIRECKEETGFSIELMDIKGVVYSRKNFSVAFLYSATIKSGIMRKFKDQEIEDVGFFQLDLLPCNVSEYALHRISLFNKNGIIVEEWDSD